MSLTGQLSCHGKLSSRHARNSELHTITLLCRGLVWWKAGQIAPTLEQQVPLPTSVLDCTRQLKKSLQYFCTWTFLHHNSYHGGGNMFLALGWKADHDLVVKCWTSALKQTVVRSLHTTACVLSSNAFRPGFSTGHIVLISVFWDCLLLTFCNCFALLAHRSSMRCLLSSEVCMHDGSGEPVGIATLVFPTTCRSESEQGLINIKKRTDLFMLWTTVVLLLLFFQACDTFKCCKAKAPCIAFEKKKIICPTPEWIFGGV